MGDTINTGMSLGENQGRRSECIGSLLAGREVGLSLFMVLLRMYYLTMKEGADEESDTYKCRHGGL